MQNHKPLKIVESPRDGWQGLNTFINTETKAEYINTLIQVGFDIIEVGSFVSPKLIPQLADTSQLISLLDTSNTSSRLMVLVANDKGVDNALAHDKISLLSYPFSFSPTFLRKNLNTEYKDGLKFIERTQKKCKVSGKELAVYITMAFGNPYGDRWSLQDLCSCVEDLIGIGIERISLTDITAEATTGTIEKVYGCLHNKYPQTEFGCHLHAGRDWADKIDAAFKNDCRMFDSVISGHGGCPMTGKEMIGNVDTLNLLTYFRGKNENLSGIDFEALKKAEMLASTIF